MQQKEQALPRLEVIKSSKEELTVSPSDSTSNPINELFDRFANILFETWKETGFGHLEIDSERIKHNKIGVTLKGSIHYRFVFSDEDVKRWTSK
ncbi:hypothetical protein ACE1CI_18790 [Aerosakkonemataceae cyanobacterium BLCC-F50]|uniref:Uncharacterized protein n=1 Tax=Floridaenema flaviceps BLCC-F50 TaxID=3153642 RepID=A0ABV4XT96_9CYAN